MGWSDFARRNGSCSRRMRTAWRSEQTIATGNATAAAGGPFAGALSLRSLQAAADEGYLYLRLTVGCLDCSPAERRPDGRPRFDQRVVCDRHQYAARHRRDSDAAVRADRSAGGANFLLVLGEPSTSRLLVADNYNPYEIVPVPGVANETDLRVRRTMTLAMKPRGVFEEVIVEPNVRRFTRDGGVLRRAARQPQPVTVRHRRRKPAPTRTRLASGMRIARPMPSSCEFRGTSCS